MQVSAHRVVFVCPASHRWRINLVVSCGLLLVLSAATPAVAQQQFGRRGASGLPPGNTTVFPPPRRTSTFPASPPTSQDQQQGLVKDSKTIVSLELLTQKDGAGIQTQLWRPVFEKLGVTVRVRRGLFNDKLGVTETKNGPLRMVKVTAELDRGGTITLPGKKFTRQNAAALGQYLRDLQTFGQQGNPDGQPLWGLNRSQFDTVYKALSVVITKDMQTQTLNKSLGLLPLPKSLPIRMNLAAQKLMRQDDRSTQTVRQSITGFSTGTGLALILSDFGLGFHPTRTPEGGLELLVKPLAADEKVWPVGWEPKDTRQRTAPALFKLIPVELDDLPLPDVLAAVSVKTGLPIRFDYRRIEAQKIDMQKIRVSHPYRRTSWSLLLRGVTNPHKLTRELMIDEGGRPFIYITTLKVGKFGQDP